MHSAVADPPRPDTGGVARVDTAGAAPLAVRVALLVVGSLLIAVAVAVTLWNDLGPGPLDVFIGAVRVRTDLPLGLAVWLVVGSMIAASWALGRRPGPGTLISPFIVGPAMQMTAALLEPFEVPDTLVVRIGVHLVAVVVIGLGAGALMVSQLGAGSGELLAAAASDRSGRSEPRSRLVIELSVLAAGVVLGGPVGLGTVLAALTIGPAVAIGHRAVSTATS